ncbi:hypothetical protein FRC17_000214 [Serendipita sp. 399]|nr:hypothetical protein FRC17_000214 [Serendipita sp. 399]
MPAKLRNPSRKNTMNTDNASNDTGATGGSATRDDGTTSASANAKKGNAANSKSEEGVGFDHNLSENKTGQKTPCGTAAATHPNESGPPNPSGETNPSSSAPSSHSQGDALQGAAGAQTHVASATGSDAAQAGNQGGTPATTQGSTAGTNLGAPAGTAPGSTAAAMTPGSIPRPGEVPFADPNNRNRSGSSAQVPVGGAGPVAGPGAMSEKDLKREMARRAEEVRRQHEEEKQRRAEEKARLEEEERRKRLQEEKEQLESRIRYYENQNELAEGEIQQYLSQNDALKFTNQQLQAKWSNASAELDAQRRTLNATRSFASREGTVDAQALIQLFNDLNASIGDFAFEVLRGLDEKAETRVLDDMDFQSLSAIFRIKPDDESDLSVDPSIYPFLKRLQKINPELSLTPMDIIDPIIQYMLCRSLYHAIFMPFAPALTVEDSNALNDLYSKMKRSEPQERRARWRSITYKQALSMQKDGAVRGFIEDQVNKFISSVYAVLNTLNRAEEAKPPTDLFKAAGDIFLAAMKVQEKAKTEYVSFDYEVSFYQCVHESKQELNERGVEQTVRSVMCHYFENDLMEVSQGDKNKPPKHVWMTVGFGMLAWKGVKKEGGGTTEDKSVPVKAKSSAIELNGLAAIASVSSSIQDWTPRNPWTLMASFQSTEVYLKEESIVIAIDIGTTMTGVSFSHMYPGEKPSIRLVNQWPGQPVAGGDAKVPTLVAYRDGVACAHGAAALEMIGDDEFQVARWFKLHLHPPSLRKQLHMNNAGNSESAQGLSDEEIPPLPIGVSLKDIYTSFMAYVYKATEDFFVNRTPNGKRIWDRLKGRSILILCTPNGWETDQQVFMRDAAISARIVSAIDADDRLEFITEGEASVHFALAYTQSDRWIKKDMVFAVVDAGGSTVDSTLYVCTSNLPRITLEEVCTRECVQAGGIFVNRAFRESLCKKLEGSKFNDDEVIDLMVNEFETKTKRLFDGTQEKSNIQFGRNKDNDPSYGILKGRITIDKELIEKSFNVTIQQIISSIRKLIGNRDVHHLLLVGGFGDSGFLRSSVKKHLSSSEVEVIVVDEPSKKAAVEGAMIWSIKQSVTARCPRYTVGIRQRNIFEPNNSLHKERADLVKSEHSGAKMLDGFFAPLILKDTPVANDFQKTFSFVRTYDSVPDTLAEFHEQIFAWEGTSSTRWTDDNSGNLLPQMRRLCILEADLSRLIPLLKPERGTDGREYYKVSYEIILEMGRTQLQARIQWRENQRVCSGSMKILPSLLVSTERTLSVPPAANSDVARAGSQGDTPITNSNATAITTPGTIPQPGEIAAAGTDLQRSGSSAEGNVGLRRQAGSASGQLTDRERKKLADQARKQQEDEIARERARLEEAERQRKIQEDKEHYESRISYYEQENATAENAILDLLWKNESLRVTNQALQAQWSHASAELDAQRIKSTSEMRIANEPAVDVLIQDFKNLNASIGDYAFEVLRGLDEKAETRVLDAMDFRKLRSIFKNKPDDPNDLSIDPNILPFLDKSEKMKGNLPLTPMDIIDPIILYMLCRNIYHSVFMPFAPGLTIEDSTILQDIHSKMRQTESQERKARWRTITYKLAMGMQKEGAVQRFIEDEVGAFVRSVYDVLNTLNRTGESKPPTDLHKAAGAIFRAAMKLQEKAKTEYVSFDYQVSFYKRELQRVKAVVDGKEQTVPKLMGHHFEAELMEISQGNNSSDPKAVWMTVGLGMIAWKGVRKAGGMDEEIRTVVKAKVICDNWDPNA